MSDDLQRLRNIRAIHPANGPTDRGLAWAVERIEALEADNTRLRDLLSALACTYVDLHEDICGDDTDTCDHPRAALDETFAALLPPRATQDTP